MKEVLKQSIYKSEEQQNRYPHCDNKEGRRGIDPTDHAEQFRACPGSVAPQAKLAMWPALSTSSAVFIFARWA